MAAARKDKNAEKMDGMKEFKVLGKLGEGSFGIVYKVKHKATGNVYVIKRVNISVLEEDEVEAALNEVNVLSMFDNPYIVRYWSSFIEDGELNIVMEFCKNGTLFQQLRRYRRKHKSLKERDIWCYFIQLCLGLHHIHSQNVLHRDMKSENVFLDENNRLRIGDLGVAKLLESHNDMTRTFVGTPYYLSPELCEGKPYNEKSDVWSLGCLLYELCTLKPPFHANNRGALMMKIVRGKFPPIDSKYSKELQVLVAKLLVRDVERRPTVVDILLDPILKAKAIKYRKRLSLGQQGETMMKLSDHSGNSGSGSSGGRFNLSGSNSSSFWSTLVSKQGDINLMSTGARVITSDDDKENIRVRKSSSSSSSSSSSNATVRRKKDGPLNSTVVRVGKAKAKKDKKGKDVTKKKSRKMADNNDGRPGRDRSASLPGRFGKPATPDTKKNGTVRKAGTPGKPIKAPASAAKAPRSTSIKRKKSSKAATAQRRRGDRNEVVREIMRHQEDLSKQMDKEKDMCVDILNGDAGLFRELFGFYKKLAKEDDRMYQQMGTLTAQEIEEKDRQQAELIEEVVMSRITQDQFKAVTKIYHLLYLKDEHAKGKKVLASLLGTRAEASSSSRSRSSSPGRIRTAQKRRPRGGDSYSDVEFSLTPS